MEATRDRVDMEQNPFFQVDEDRQNIAYLLDTVEKQEKAIAMLMEAVTMLTHELNLRLKRKNESLPSK